jgi:hypothetical protein
MLGPLGKHHYYFTPGMPVASQNTYDMYTRQRQISVLRAAFPN